MKRKLIPSEEIAVKSYEDAQIISERFLENGYVVMISREENLFIINYLWASPNLGRNDVVFMSRDDYLDTLPEEE